MQCTFIVITGPVDPVRDKYFVEMFPPGTEIKAGDTKHLWDRDNETEVEVARDMFNKLTSRGFTAFRVEGKEGTKSTRMTEFDPKAERVIFSPKIQGGR